MSLVPNPLASVVDALSLPWEDLDPYAFAPVAILGKVVDKNHSDRARVAQHALDLGPSGHVEPDPIVSVQPALFITQRPVRSVTGICQTIMPGS